MDGDNVFRALGVMPAAGGPAGAEPVEALLNRLEVAAARADWEVTVVFDGPERFLPRERGILTVRYAKGRKADALIERMLYEETASPGRAGGPGQTVVVTRDRALGDLAAGRGAVIWPPERLRETIGN